LRSPSRHREPVGRVGGNIERKKTCVDGKIVSSVGKEKRWKEYFPLEDLWREAINRKRGIRLGIKKLGGDRIGRENYLALMGTNEKLSVGRRRTSGGDGREGETQGYRETQLGKGGKKGERPAPKGGKKPPSFGKKKKLTWGGGGIKKKEVQPRTRVVLKGTSTTWKSGGQRGKNKKNRDSLLLNKKRRKSPDV